MIYGFTLSASWKGFDIILFGQGIAGAQVFNATRRFDLQMANMTTDALDRWTGEGTSDSYPHLVMNDPNKNFSSSSDFYVENASFFRIRTLQLGYTLPLEITSKAGIKKYGCMFQEIISEPSPNTMASILKLAAAVLELTEAFTRRPCPFSLEAISLFKFLTSEITS